MDRRSSGEDGGRGGRRAEVEEGDASDRDRRVSEAPGLGPGPVVDGVRTSLPEAIVVMGL